MSMNMKLASQWQDSVFFNGSPPGVLKRVESLVDVRSYAAGSRIFSEGDLATDLYLLKSGQVELTFSLPTRPDVSLRITIVNPGEVFAWSALTGGDHLTANAVAIEDSEAFVIPTDGLQAVMNDDAHFGYQIMTRLSRLVASRLEDTRRQLQWLHASGLS